MVVVTERWIAQKGTYTLLPALALTGDEWLHIGQMGLLSPTHSAPQTHAHTHPFFNLAVLL